MKLSFMEKSPDPTRHFSTGTDRVHDRIFIEEQNKNLLSKNKQSIPLLTTTLLTPSISQSHLFNLNSVDNSQIFVKSNSLITPNSSKLNSNRILQAQSNNIDQNLLINTSDSFNSNYYFKHKTQPNQHTYLRNSNLSIQSSNVHNSKQNLNSNSQDLVYTSNNSLANSSMVMNRYQDPNMAQYTKFTKNIFAESYNSTANGAKIEKSPSRGSNFTSPMPSVINGTPLSIQHSAGLQSQIKAERFKASPSIGRSSTLKYTKSYMENNNLAQKQPMHPQYHTQHFNFSAANRKYANNQFPQPQQQQQLQQQQVQESITKKDFINVLNNIQRSSSIKLGREKTSLSNYFSSLSNTNKLNHGSNGSVNGSMTNTHQIGFNFISSSNNVNSLNSQLNKTNQLNQRPKHGILKANNLNLNKYLDQIMNQTTGLKISSSIKSNRNDSQEIKESTNRVRVSQNIDDESEDSDQIVEYINIEDFDDKKKSIKNIEEIVKNNNIANIAEPSSQLSNTNYKKDSNKNYIKTSTRPLSRVSYVSRDVNDSYAYTNVKQYIEENELLPPEKSESIRRWIKDVNLYVDDWEQRTIEINIVQE